MQTQQCFVYVKCLTIFIFFLYILDSKKEGEGKEGEGEEGGEGGKGLPCALLTSRL